MRKNKWIAWASAGAAVAAMATPGRALAQTMCPDPAFPNAVYVAGSTAIQPVLQALAVQLGSQATIIYFANGSCKGLAAVLGSSSAPGSGPNGVSTGLTYLAWPLSGTDGSLETVGTSDTPGYNPTCTVGQPQGTVQGATVAGQAIDVAFSDVYPATCATNAQTGLLSQSANSSMQEFLGPVQAMGFWVPSTSQQDAISAEAAYVVFGWAGTGDKVTQAVAPWTTSTEIFHRSTSSGTQGMIASAIGLPSNKWQGTSEPDTQTLLSAVQNGTDPNASIGIAGAEDTQVVSTDTASNLKMLAYQHGGQGCGYYPNSNANKRDMINVRQGRYAIWGPVHLVVKVDANGNPVDHTGQPNAALTAFMNYFIATGPTASPASQGDGGISETNKAKFHRGRSQCRSRPLVRNASQPLGGSDRHRIRRNVFSTSRTVRLFLREHARGHDQPLHGVPDRQRMHRPSGFRLPLWISARLSDEHPPLLYSTERARRHDRRGLRARLQQQFHDRPFFSC